MYDDTQTVLGRVMRREKLTGADLRHLRLGRSGNTIVAETARHVIRIAWCAPLRVDVETRVWQAARNAGVPVPELAGRGRVGTHEYMVYTRLPGWPSPADRAALRAAGSTLAALHAAPPRGFPATLDARPRRMRRFALAGRFMDRHQGQMPHAVASCVRLAEQDWASTFDTMTHGDFRGPNILARGNRITGVLDWSDARMASREADLGSLAWAGFPDILDGYLAAAPTPQGGLLLGYFAARYSALAASGVLLAAQALDAVDRCVATLADKKIAIDPGDTIQTC